MASCAKKPEITTSKSVLLLFKTPAIKFYETAFLQRYDDGIRLQVYGASTALFELQVESDTICYNGVCGSPAHVVGELLSAEYPEDFLWNLLRGQPLGFFGDSEVRYEKQSGQVSFSDPNRGISIMLKDLQ